MTESYILLPLRECNGNPGPGESILSADFLGFHHWRLGVSELECCIHQFLRLALPQGAVRHSHRRCLAGFCAEPQYKRELALQSFVQQDGGVTTLGTARCFSSKHEICHTLNLRYIKSINVIVVSSPLYAHQN